MINPFRDIGLLMRESTGPEPGGPNGLQGEPDHIFRTGCRGSLCGWPRQRTWDRYWSSSRGWPSTSTGRSGGGHEGRAA